MKQDAAKKLRVFLADDHPVVLAGIRSLINNDPTLEVVGEAADGRVALRMATDLSPDVLVLDISLPGLNGMKMAELLRSAVPQCKIVVLTVHEDRSYVRRLLELGVRGYLLKRSASAELLRAIGAVAGGGLYLDPAIAGKALASAPAAGVATGTIAADLSEREIDVLRLTASGHSNKAMASTLGIAIKTVETHKARAMEKLGFQNRVDVVRFAVQQGWLSDN